MSGSKALPQGASGDAGSGAPAPTAAGALASTATPVPVTDPAQMSAALAAMRQQGERWRNYAYLLERIRQARNLNELTFSLANEVWQLFPYTQGFVWQLRGTGSQLRTVSGLAQLAGDSPLTTWLHRLGRWLQGRLEAGETPEAMFVQIDDVPDNLRDGWREWLPAVLAPASQTGDARAVLLGFVGYALANAPSDRVQEFTTRAVAAYGDAWHRLAPAGRAPRAWRRWAAWVAVLALVAAMFIPVRLSVLAPAEIVGLDAVAVNAPMEGVIKSFAVAPNQTVSKDQLLYTLDDTTLRNNREVAARQLEVARADALAAAQKSFANVASRAELASLNGIVAEREAELASVVDRLMAWRCSPTSMTGKANRYAPVSGSCCWPTLKSRGCLSGCRCPMPSISKRARRSRSTCRWRRSIRCPVSCSKPVIRRSLRRWVCSRTGCGPALTNSRRRSNNACALV